MLKTVVIYTIYIYQIFLSPFLVTLFGKGCRFQPTCSQYACSAIDNHGVFKGSILSIKRIVRCNPFSN